jgi:hypothetical protein
MWSSNTSSSGPANAQKPHRLSTDAEVYGPTNAWPRYWDQREAITRSLVAEELQEGARDREQDQNYEANPNQVNTNCDADDRAGG